MTLAEIARLAGVSRTTASYVVNGKSREHRISDETVKRVMSVVDTHHYRVDAQAAALRRGASRTLGFILPDLENASYARLAKRLEQGARERGYQLLIVGSDDRPDTEKELARGLKARRCDALIVASSLAPDDPFYREIMSEDMPVIAVDRALDPDFFTCVVSNNGSAAEALTRSVIDERTRHIVWLDAVPELSISASRRAGFRRALPDSITRISERSGSHYTRRVGAELMQEVLDTDGLPDALITASYTLLDGVLDVLLAHSARPDIRIATFGDDRLLDFLPLPVNALPQQYDRIAQMTLECAFQAIEGNYRPGLNVVERTLKLRQ
ncbi:catabolite repressor/activator [Larsenimonas salina]|uniref:catabolite repressor/activator n=1 Tax=Larsenimonas salina TaxID=1295565 RepID=UPI0020739054|nr:catabolite repressor/activator [Larsenimonas salina]MCM5705399.1 catabolite repressor/activator [Larsenimonas salina]